MAFVNVYALGMNLAFAVVIACFLWSTVGGCENATEGAIPLGVFSHHPTLNTCITDIVRAICNALRPSPMKRKFGIDKQYSWSTESSARSWEISFPSFSDLPNHVVRVQSW